LKSDVGAVIMPQDSSKVTSKDIQIKTLAAEDKIVVEFPLKNDFSYMIGPMKVYPVIAKYIKDK